MSFITMLYQLVSLRGGYVVPHHDLKAPIIAGRLAQTGSVYCLEAITANRCPALATLIDEWLYIVISFGTNLTILAL